MVAPGEAHRSLLASNATGWHSGKAAAARKRSRRLGLRSRLREVTRNGTSRLAASNCSSPDSPAALRESLLVRSSTASITAGLASAETRSATQSPTAGKSARLAARWRSRPLTAATPSPYGP